MAWNFLNSLLEKLSGELLLLALSALWLLLRLFQVVVKKVEKGKPVEIKILGRKFVEIKEGLEEHQEQQEKEEIHLEEGLGTRRKDNHTFSVLTVKPVSYQKNQQHQHIKEKEVGTKW
jgi:hypothetical protein